ncbi:MAG TPA: PhnD/SsuA/transferrin family substrate-binding protein [Planctomycetota bacterium]|nr:PhnD/SsuA/transferrin family substrate-binding protein [Planctomycetota bacterium]
MVRAVLLLGTFLCAWVIASDAPLRIAVLANRGDEEALRRWQPTADYLKREIPACDFKIVPLDFDAIVTAVERAEVDFVVANSGLYVLMEVRFGVSRIATLKNLRNGIVCKNFGGVIFTLTRNESIRELADLKGKRFMAVDERSLGGWQMAWRELKSHGVDPYQHFTSLSFGGTHDAVLHAVREQKVDAGTVRTDLFERISAEGKVDLSHFKILNQQEKTADFPFMRSTKLYPEWPFAKLRHTSDDVAQKVASALLAMPAQSAAASAAECAGWTVPLDYSAVHECFRELRVSPYENYGKVPLRDVLHEYRWWIAAALAGVLALIVFVVRYIHLNRNLLRAQKRLETELAERRRAEVQLEAARADLESRVAERTAELAEVNRGLRSEIEQRSKAMAELHASEERFRQLAENIRQVFWISNPETSEILYVSPAFEAVFGRSPSDLPIRRETLLDLVHPEDRAALTEALEQQSTGGWELEFRIIHPRSGVRRLRARAFPVRNAEGSIYRIAGLAEDITERRQLEQQYIHAQKMNAIGQLAGGVAHDFNNVLSTIISSAELALMNHPRNSSDAERLSIIINSANRAAELTRKLLSFARRGKSQNVPLSVNDLVRDTVAVLGRTLGPSVKIDTQLEARPDVVRGDATELQSALLNLSVNARDAMPEGGVITIRTHTEELSAERCATLPQPVRPGPHVVVSVTDTGSGIAAEILPRIFEPFFTTKPIGKGTGLGLAAVLGAVQAHQGAIEVTTVVNSGTTFTSYFPAEAIPAETPRESPVPVLRFSGRAAVVDDDGIVCNSTAEILRAIGFQTEAFTDPFRARDSLLSMGTFQVVVLDLAMPGMSGLDLYRFLRGHRPTVPIIIATGYAGSSLQGIEDTHLVHLAKPFSVPQLCEAIVQAGCGARERAGSRLQ